MILDAYGFHSVRLTRKGYLRGWHPPSGRQRLLHSVVWEAHRGPVPDGFQLHHKNYDRMDCDIDNLELRTSLENKRLHAGCYVNGDGAWVKQCSGCGEFLVIAKNFYTRKDGVNSECKVCAVKRAVIDKHKQRARALAKDPKPD